MRSHTGDKPYACSYCDSAFFTSSKLIRHEKTHTDDRQFVCHVLNCDKTFYRKDHLNAHILTHKNKMERDVYTCDYCHCVFMNKTSLYTHIKKHMNGHFERLKKKPQKRHLVKNNDTVFPVLPTLFCTGRAKQKKIKQGNKNKDVVVEIEEMRFKNFKKSEKENLAPFTEIRNSITSISSIDNEIFLFNEELPSLSAQVPEYQINKDVFMDDSSQQHLIQL